MTILRGRGCIATKININFFVRNEVFNIFHITIKKKKKKLFSKITVKNNFWGMTIFQGIGRRMTKINITFSMGNGIPNTKSLSLQVLSYSCHEYNVGVVTNMVVWFYNCGSEVFKSMVMWLLQI